MYMILKIWLHIGVLKVKNWLYLYQIYLYIIVGAYFTVGAEIDAITDHNLNAIELKESTEAAIKILDRIIKAVPLYKLMPTKLLKDFNRSTDKMNEIGRKYAALYMEKINDSVQKAEGKKRIGQSLMEQWLIEGRMPIETAIQSSTVLLATGMDTVSKLYLQKCHSFFFYTIDSCNT